MYKIILASNSPRRKELLGGLGVEFEVRIIDGIDESYPDSMPVSDIAEYIAGKKAGAYMETIGDDELVITADTVVISEGRVLGKPKDACEARCMLGSLSGKTHQVVTGVCLMTSKGTNIFSVATDVTFKELEQQEVDFYIERYAPYDKAGAYGIQEWIGYIGVTAINGSYFNVMGFPVQRIYSELKKYGIF